MNNPFENVDLQTPTPEKMAKMFRRQIVESLKAMIEDKEITEKTTVEELVSILLTSKK